MRKRFSSGKYLANCVYKSHNVVIQQMKNNPAKKKCILIGDGHFLSVDEKLKINGDGIIPCESQKTKFATETMRNKLFSCYFIKKGLKLAQEIIK